MNLAIKGHPTRGNKVIEILEMLGGSNPHNYSADCDSLCFTIGKGTNIIYYDWVKECYEDEDTLVFTLEEFLEKFPYKVGDKVSSKYLKNYKIVKMEWEDTNNRVIYKLQGMGWYNSDELEYYKEETMEEKGTLVQIDLTRELCVDDEVEVILGDYEFVLKDGKTYFVKKKPQYPKTYEECCGISDIYPIYNKPNLCICEWHPETREMHEHYSKLANLSQKDIAFMILRICRDAYWKIAGEEMGLDKPWEPDWKDASYKYFICYIKDEIWISNTRDCNRFLGFPTKEMRDTFYENFKELINQCKELL